MEKTKVYSIHNNHLLNTLTIKRKYQSRTIEDIKFINTNLIVFVLIKCYEQMKSQKFR